MVSRIAKGTASSKISGTSLTLSNVEVLPGQSLVVGVTYDTGQGAPVVTWGGRELSKIIVQAESGAATALFLLRHIKNANTRTITCTWSAAITAKAMFATVIAGANIQDVSAKNSSAATTDPTTGAAVTSTDPDTISIAAFGSQGPNSDAAGTVGAGHTSGQRTGTAGAPPASNVTIHETFEILTATGNVRATKTGATSRSWANVIMAIKPSVENRQGITPSDLQEVERLVEAAGGDYNNVVFKFDSSTDEWKAYETTTLGTLRATRSVEGLWS